MSPLIRIPDETYRRLQALAQPFVDTPAIVIDRLLDEHERNPTMTASQTEATIGAEGYLMQAQEDWLGFHTANTVGGTAFYCRGAGAPMRNVRDGGTIFLAKSGERPHRIHLRGEFAGWKTMDPDAAWSLYGPQLGAATKEAWQELLGRIESIAESGLIGLIRIENVTPVPGAPRIADADVELKRGSMKGRALSSHEVSRLLDLEQP